MGPKKNLVIKGLRKKTFHSRLSNITESYLSNGPISVNIPVLGIHEGTQNKTMVVGLPVHISSLY